MAFNPANLVLIDRGVLGVGGPCGWRYSTPDNLSAVEGSGYFDDAVVNFRDGDIFGVDAGDGKKLYRFNIGSSVSAVSIIALATVSSFNF